MPCAAIVVKRNWTPWRSSSRREKTKELGISEDMLKRAVNVGFSGGEKKRNEVLQMAVLNPSLAILDETDMARILTPSRLWPMA